MQNLIPINWAFGTLALFAALFYPTLDQKLRVEALKISAEGTVRTILDQQVAYYSGRESYVQFGARSDEAVQGFRKLTMDRPDTDVFEYESFVDDKGALVIRARATGAQVRSGNLPPLLYEYRKPIKGAEEAKWMSLSRKTRGLF